MSKNTVLKRNNIRHPMRFLILRYFIFFALILSHPSYAERVESIPYNPITPKSTAKALLDKEDWAVFNITLPSIQANIPPANGGMIQTGIVYPLPNPVISSQLVWTPVTGGYIAHVHLVAEHAKRLRFHLRAITSSNIAFRVQGSMDHNQVGPIDQSAINSGEVWLPLTKGDSADLEIFTEQPVLPGSIIFVLDAINFIVADAVDGGDSGIVSKSNGNAKEEEYDLECWNRTTDYTPLSYAASATAKIDYIKNGRSYLCTGALLNDKDSTNTPWFATANHCISDQTTANTATFEWFFQATTCKGSTVDSRYTQTFGGAQLLWTNFNYDFSFLKLNKSPPDGVYFAGWDTDINIGDLIYGVHHPKGDHTMVSQGLVTKLLQTIHDNDQGGTHVLDTVKYTYGGTEGGSSGSGLFAVRNNTFYWKGTLFGDPSDDYKNSAYSHLNSYYSNIKVWLENSTTKPLPTVSFSASPTSVNYNGSSTLSWSSVNATSCIANGDWSGTFGTSGSWGTGSLTNSKTYMLTCSGSGGTTSQSVTVTVNPPKLLPTISLSALPATIDYNGEVHLNWTTINAITCTISDGAGLNNSAVYLQSSQYPEGYWWQKSLQSNKTFTLTCTGNGGTTSQSVTVTVATKPPTMSLSATPTSVNYNGSSTLSWSSVNATSCIANGDWSGTFNTSGSWNTGSLTNSKTYMLTCSGSGGTTSKSITVTVGAKPTSPPIPCVFNWLESKYPQYYAPVSTSLLTSGSNSYRYYEKTDSLLVYNPIYDNVYSGYSYYGYYYYIDLGSFTDWKNGTGCK